MVEAMDLARLHLRVKFAWYCFARRICKQWPNLAGKTKCLCYNRRRNTTGWDLSLTLPADDTNEGASELIVPLT